MLDMFIFFSFLVLFTTSKGRKKGKKDACPAGRQGGASQKSS
jgi:hypothetical protein